MKFNINDELKNIVIYATQKYGSLEEPNFSFIEKTIKRRPYQMIEQALQTRFLIKEDTDPNDDVSFVYILENRPSAKAGFGSHIPCFQIAFPSSSNKENSWILRLSMVGEYAYLCRINQNNKLELVSEGDFFLRPEEREIISLLRQHNIKLLNKAILEEPLRIKRLNANYEKTYVFQVLFADRDIFPWAV